MEVRKEQTELADTLEFIQRKYLRAMISLTLHKPNFILPEQIQVQKI